MSDKTVSVLFARKTSVYKTMAADVWDAERDARRYDGAAPVVAHPPCRAWGRLAAMAKPRDDEKALALFAVDTVRRVGGVLEHPAHSQLWPAKGLPKPGEGRDEFGGYTLSIYQSDFGHRAPKATWLYVCGIEPGDLPELPWPKELPPGRIELMCRAERERTPPELAAWLLEAARRARGNARSVNGQEGA